MSKYIFFIFFLFGAFQMNAQNGLEKIIVEKYYISDENDVLANSFGGKLPVGSVTYRVYADMLPGYRFQAAYGSPEHKLQFSTSTAFFNNEDIGSTYPNMIPQRALSKNTVMLDSWLSVGAAGENYFGILKQDDISYGSIENDKQLLKNTNSLSGIPISERDGLVFSSKVPRPTFFGIDSAVTILNNQTNGSEFSIDNGAWLCLGGSVGSDSLTNNRVLIAQMTTDGDFSFELNIQIGTPTPGGTQKYVARNPIGNEILLPSLIYKVKGNKRSKKKNKSERKKERKQQS